MRNIRKILALLLALFLTAALCGCAASRMDDGLAGTSGSDSVKPADMTDFMSYAGPIFPLTLAQAAPALSADREILLDCAPYAEEYENTFFNEMISTESAHILRPIQL